MRNLKGLLCEKYLLPAATPFCLHLRELILADKWADAVRLKIDPLSYTNADHYRLDAQALALISKNASVEAGVDTSAEAKKAWWEAEHRCASTNAWLNQLVHGPTDPDDEFAYEFLLKVRKKVQFWLGRIPSDLNVRFGPGSTLSCNPAHSTLADKIETVPTTTVDAWYIAERILPKTAWFRSLVERGTLNYRNGSLSGYSVSQAGRWSSVRKNALTDRSIEIGPDINVALQLAVGQHWTQELARKGWILKKSAEVNTQILHQRVAEWASVSGAFATIDLKQASDSVSRKLVEFLVGPEWFQLLDSLRTRMIVIDGKRVFLEKFSGMGNGYTFELESIIFASFAQVCMELSGYRPKMGGSCFVFGDDIIVPTPAARLVILALRRFGFVPNEKKTFLRGPFRESCGGDYFRGANVRPFYLEEEPDEPAKWIVFANGIRRVGYDDVKGIWRDPAYLRLWHSILDAVPADVRRLRGPAALGDLVIHDEPDRWITKQRNSRHWIRSYRARIDRRSFRRGGSVIPWGEFPDAVVLATRLYRFPGESGPSTDRDKNHETATGIIPRYPELTYRIGWTPLVSY